jgi:hypothetical protein
LRSRIGYALIALAAALLGLAMSIGRAQLPALERPDHWTLDWQTQWRGRLAPGTELPLLLVRVDDAALEALGGRVPDRAEMARAVQALQAGGARAVALDILLLPGGGTPEGSAALASAMKACACVLIPFSLPDDGAADAQAPPAPVLAQALLRYDDEAALARSERYYRPTRLVAPEAGLAEAAAALGHISVRPETDGPSPPPLSPFPSPPSSPPPPPPGPASAPSSASATRCRSVWTSCRGWASTTTVPSAALTTSASPSCWPAASTPRGCRGGSPSSACRPWPRATTCPRPSTPACPAWSASPPSPTTC